MLKIDSKQLRAVSLSASTLLTPKKKRKKVTSGQPRVKTSSKEIKWTFL